jgi:hypothetical protein
MTVYIADVHAHIQRPVSTLKMATVLECTTEEQNSVLRFLWAKDSVQRIFVKECFLFMVGSICRVKRFTTGSKHSLKDVKNSQVMPGAMVATEATAQRVKN